MPVVRLQDVAKKAEVSVATASLALSGKGRISEAVRVRVRSAAHDLGYRTGRPARGRPHGAAVGILHAEDRTYEWNFVRPTIAALEHALLNKGLLPALLPIDTGADSGLAVRLTADAGVGGVFAIQFADAVLFTELASRGVPVVVINNSGLQDRFPTVCVDDFQGAYEGALHLLSLGHRSIAFVEYERPESPSVVADRFIGFRKALEEHQVTFSPERRITVPFMDVKKLRRKLEALFSRPARPTAIFAHDDYLGLYVIDALRQIGVEVPRDVSLLAPGDVLDYSLPLIPQITTMRIDTELLGRLASSVMLERMTKRGTAAHVIKVKEQLVRRATCRPVKED
jgi:DNA-binding LacI/PurR family transcriptional regulator